MNPFASREGNGATVSWHSLPSDCLWRLDVHAVEISSLHRGRGSHPSGTPPQDPRPASGRPSTGVLMSPHDILALDRLAFLALALSRMGLPEAAVADLTKTHSDSTRRLCESGWKMFQSFVRQI